MHQTREIPRDAWADYLTLLSSIEQDHHVRIEAVTQEYGDQSVAGSRPLLDISLEEAGSAQGSIEVTVGHPGEEFTHRIAHPEHVWAGESEQGDLECLDIEDADHVKTLIYFEPMHPREEAAPL
jgi:hypothetical protein